MYALTPEEERALSDALQTDAYLGAPLAPMSPCAARRQRRSVFSGQ